MGLLLGVKIGSGGAVGTGNPRRVNSWSEISRTGSPEESRSMKLEKFSALKN